MKVHSATLAALALTLAAGSAHAAGTQPTSMKPSSESAPKAEKRYCVKDTVTGSRIPMKVCQTRKDWLARGFDPLAPND